MGEIPATEYFVTTSFSGRKVQFQCKYYNGPKIRGGGRGRVKKEDKKSEMLSMQLGTCDKRTQTQLEIMNTDYY